MMLGGSGTFKLIISTLILFGLGAIVLNFISYNRRQMDRLLQNRLKTYNAPKITSTVSSIIMADFKSNTKPEKLTVKKIHTTISIHKYNVSLKDEKVSK